MNLVLFDSEKELELCHAFFPQDEFVVARSISSEKEWVAFKQSASKKPEQKFCVVLSKTDSALLQKSRQAGFLVAVEGRTLQHGLWACQQKADFFLVVSGFEKPALDLSVLNVAREQKTGIALFWAPLLNANPFERAQWFRNAFFLSSLCKKARVSLHVFSGARSFWECRSEKNLGLVKDFLLAAK